MRPMPTVAVVAYALVILHSSAAPAGFIDTGPGLTGNDNGGIIQWTPGVDYKAVAVSHCGRWNRYAGITSVNRVYGDYVGFRCVFDRRFDPRKAGLPPPY
jgi:hypothetical protein